MGKQLIREPQAGLSLWGSVKHFDQQKIDRFGSVSGGVGAIHLDPVFGREKTKYGATLVQGYLLIGLITELMKINFGAGWMRSGVMDAKLVGPVMSGDSVVTGGTIRQLEDQADGTVKVSCSTWVKNAEGALVVVADTSFLFDQNMR